MTLVIKQRTLDNGYYITIEQGKFSTAFHVSMFDPDGRTEKSNIYGDIDKAKRAFYSYSRQAKNF